MGPINQRLWFPFAPFFGYQEAFFFEEPMAKIINFPPPSIIDADEEWENVPYAEWPRPTQTAFATLSLSKNLPLQISGHRAIQHRIEALDKKIEGEPSLKELEKLSAFIAKKEGKGADFADEASLTTPQALLKLLRTPRLRAKELGRIELQIRFLELELRGAPSYTEEERDLLEKSLGALRPATAKEYVRFLAARLRNGGTLDLFQEESLFAEMQLLYATREVTLPPSNYPALRVIVPHGVAARFLTKAGHGKFYRMDYPSSKRVQGTVCSEILGPLRRAVGLFEKAHFGPHFCKYMAAYLIRTQGEEGAPCAPRNVSPLLAGPKPAPDAPAA